MTPGRTMGAIGENPYRAPTDHGNECAECGRPFTSGRDSPQVTWALFLAEFTAAMLFAFAYLLWRHQI